MEIDPRLHAEVAAHPYPLMFVTVSGAHLYGFPSPDSDYDLRGAHMLPLRDIVGLDKARETVELSHVRDGVEMDLVTHDLRKYFNLLLKNSGYALEQVLSPLVVHTTPAHEELKHIARGSVSRLHARHYFGFAENQWRLFEKKTPHRVKPLLYIYRVLLTGIHMMRTGAVETNLLTLNDELQSPQVADLIARKIAEPEQTTLPDADLTFYRAEYERLRQTLQEAEERSTLSEENNSRAALNDMLIRLRLGSLHGSHEYSQANVGA
jgi:hypothetical protein